MKVALYARVSTREQDTDNQMIRLVEYANRRGYSVFREYRDVVSGAKNKKRPEQEQMLEDAKHHKFDKIISIKLDRVGRSVINLFDILLDLEAWGVSLEIVDQPIDTSTAIGRFLTTVVGAAAEYERELIVERTKDGLERTKKKGTKLGRKAKELSDYQRTKIEMIISENPNISYRKLAEQFEGISRTKLIELAKAEGLINRADSFQIKTPTISIYTN